MMPFPVNYGGSLCFCCNQHPQPWFFTAPAGTAGTFAEELPPPGRTKHCSLQKQNGLFELYRWLDWG